MLHMLHIFPRLNRSLPILLLLAATSLARAEPMRLDINQTKSGDALKAAFHDVVDQPSRSTVLIRCAGKDAALGAVVSADGYILTKASELTAPITCRLRDGHDLPATLVGVVEAQDLAMLKIAAQDLTPIVWGDSKKVDVGEWVAATTISDKPLAVGVISVGRRKIPARSGILGVTLAEADKKNGAKVIQILPGSAAEKVGIQIDDVITQVAGKPVTSREDLVNTIRAYKPGDQIQLTVERADKTLAFSATLGATTAPTNALSRFDIQNILGGPTSKRAANFPAVLQHDTILRPTECGGPLVDLDGKTIALNIARAGRTESYAIPADLILPLIPALKAGKYPPPSAAASQPDTVPAPATRPKRRAA